ncbi:MAG TPA: hypothetical protein EYN69_07815, partial [Flavobacteriales bacterium]|nr:hypothetical protein [Flavobacteriales bacterium]
MVDRVVIGKVNNLKSGFWASKPGTDVKHLIDGTIPADDWYGYQQEWDWNGQGGTVFAQSDPGETANATWTDSGGRDFSRYSCHTSAEGFKRTSNGTVLYTGGYGDIQFRTPYWIDDLNASQQWWIQKPNYQALIGDDYQIVEARIRRLPSPDPPVDGTGFQIFYTYLAVGGWPNPPGASTGSGAAGGQSGSYHLRVTSIDGTPTNFSSGDGAVTETWKTIFPDAEVTSEPSPWKVLEWNASNDNQVGRDRWLAGLPAGVDVDSRIVLLRFDFTDENVTTDPTTTSWDPETDPMWEIDYIRVKKPTVPINSGRWNSKRGAMIFDSDESRTGLVHATGTVTIGTQKAFINGATSGYVAGFHDGTQISNGYVSFPELPYIPLVLFKELTSMATLQEVHIQEAKKNFLFAHRTGKTIGILRLILLVQKDSI